MHPGAGGCVFTTIWAESGWGRVGQFSQEVGRDGLECAIARVVLQTACAQVYTTICARSTREILVEITA